MHIRWPCRPAERDTQTHKQFASKPGEATCKPAKQARKPLSKRSSKRGSGRARKPNRYRSQTSLHSHTVTELIQSKNKISYARASTPNSVLCLIPRWVELARAASAEEAEAAAAAR